MSNVIIPELVGGVSQLPVDQRGANQVEILTNAFPSKANGLIKRPPCASVGQLKADQVGWASAFLHPVGRTEDERYLIVIADDDLKVFDTLTGVEQTVSFPDGKAYITDNVRGLRAFTVGDHTFIVNRDFEVRMSEERRYPDNFADALIFCRMADANVSYGFKVDNFPVSFKTGKSTYSTDGVASGLYKEMTSNHNHTHFLAQFDVELIGSSVYLKRKDGREFSISGVFDGLADKGLKIVKRKVQSMEDLPEKGKDGMEIEIEGEPGKPEDNTWVRFETDEGGIGVWKEITAPYSQVGFDNSTMPHELVREGTYGKPNPHQPLPRQPTYARVAAAATAYGFTTDGAGAAIGTGADQAKTIDVYTSAVRTAGVTTGSHATLTRQVVFGYDVDTGVHYSGAPALVVFSVNTGAGWVELGKRYYSANKQFLNETQSYVGVYPSGTKFEVKLQYPPYYSHALADSRQVAISVHGDADQIPGLRIGAAGSLRFSIGKTDTFWPKNAVVSVTVDASTYNYTLTDDMTSDDVAAAISAVVDAAAGFVSAVDAPRFYSAFGGFSSPDPADPLFIEGALGPIPFYVDAEGFTVSTVAGDAPTTASCTITLDNTKYFFNDDAGMVADEHVGRIIRNITDGSEAVITDNSERTITVAALLGGTDNIFETNDECSVLDSGSATYIFREVSWDERTVGGTDGDKLPSIVGRRLSEVFFHAGRLGFTSEDFVVLSAAGGLRRFWRKSMVQHLDDDPIDIQNAHKDVGFLDSAISWDGRLLLCSSSGHQFALVGEPALTFATVRLEHMSSYPQTDECRPLVAGSSVYFASKGGGFSQLRELYATRDGIDSESCTAHASRYIPGEVISMAGDVDLGFLALLPNGGSQGDVYIYCYEPLGRENRQKALAKWTFGARVLGIDCFDGYLYVVRYRGTGIYLDKIAIGNPPTPVSAHMDAGSGTGTGNYAAQVRLNQLFVADRNGNPIRSGRTQILGVRPQVDSGDVTVAVTPDNRSARSYAVTERRPRAPVLAENKAVVIDLTNSGATGFCITGLEYEVMYTNRSR